MRARLPNRTLARLSKATLIEPPWADGNVFDYSSGVTPVQIIDYTSGDDDAGDAGIAVGVSVRVYPGTERERFGVVVEDFGDAAGQRVEIGQHRIVDAARRWAVRVSDGSLVFVDSADLTLS
jgi:hypothetical protein